MAAINFKSSSISLQFKIVRLRIIKSFRKKYKVYYALGESKKDYSDFSMIYKFKFVYYMIMFVICLIKFIMSLMDVVSYKIYGDTNLLFHIIQLIGLY